MSKIIVIGLGPGNEGSLTLDAAEKICNGNKVFLRTKEHPAIKYLERKNIIYESYDYLYQEKDSIEEVYEAIVDNLVETSRKHGEINYCVPGNPVLGETTVSKLIILRDMGEIELEIISGMSFIDVVLSSLCEDSIDGLKIIDGLDFKEGNLDINSNNIIVHIYNKELASEAKLKLAELYGDDHEIYVVKAAGVTDEEKISRIPIFKLDRIEWINHLTSIFVPKMGKNNKKFYDMNNLINIMETLRSENGCKWDIKQTHKSLREYLIEEAYEVVDAIDKEDVDLICEELGDLLLQVIFHSQIAREEGYFNIWNVINGISEKLIYRHPHVFGEVEVNNDVEATDSWNKMKDKEKNIKSYTERLKNVTKGLSSLLRSYKIQDKASEVGFDWKDISGAFSKVEEELQEVKEIYREDDKEKKEEELGDLLFAVVNVCRFANINPEVALNKTISKFIKRFGFIERESHRVGMDLKEMTLEEMDRIWELSKIYNN